MQIFGLLAGALALAMDCARKFRDEPGVATAIAAGIAVAMVAVPVGIAFYVRLAPLLD